MNWPRLFSVGAHAALIVWLYYLSTLPLPPLITPVLQVDLVEPPGSRMKKIGRGMLIGALVGAGFATAALGAANEHSDPKNPGQVIAAAAGIGAIAGGQYVTEVRAARTVYIAP